ncbi:MAG TPA: hypothetical protein GXX18_20340 [Bacillales bacterium]|nr:hypothetical protein [Bacillales bacterium]
MGQGTEEITDASLYDNFAGMLFRHVGDRTPLYGMAATSFLQNRFTEPASFIPGIHSGDEAGCTFLIHMVEYVHGGDKVR